MKNPLYSLHCFPLYSWDGILGYRPNCQSWQMESKHPCVLYHQWERRLIFSLSLVWPVNFSVPQVSQVLLFSLLEDCSCRWTFKSAEGAMPLHFMGLTPVSWFCIPFAVFTQLSVRPHSATNICIIFYSAAIVLCIYIALLLHIRWLQSFVWFIWIRAQHLIPLARLPY